MDPPRFRLTLADGSLADPVSAAEVDALALRGALHDYATLWDDQAGRWVTAATARAEAIAPEPAPSPPPDAVEVFELGSPPSREPARLPPPLAALTPPSRRQKGRLLAACAAFVAFLILLPTLVGSLFIAELGGRIPGVPGRRDGDRQVFVADNGRIEVLTGLQYRWQPPAELDEPEVEAKPASPGAHPKPSSPGPAGQPLRLLGPDVELTILRGAGTAGSGASADRVTSAARARADSGSAQAGQETPADHGFFKRPPSSKGAPVTTVYDVPVAEVWYEVRATYPAVPSPELVEEVEAVVMGLRPRVAQKAVEE